MTRVRAGGREGWEGDTVRRGKGEYSCRQEDLKGHFEIDCRKSVGQGGKLVP